MNRILLSLALLAVSAWAAAAQAENAAPDPEIGQLNGQISRLSREKRFAEAAAVGKKVVELTGTKLGRQHLEHGKAWHTLGYLHFVQGEKNEADKCLDNALKIYELNAGPAVDQLTARALETLASIRYEKNRYEEAGRLLEKALAIHARTGGAQSPQAVSNRSALANVNYTMARYDAAAKLYRQVFDDRRAQPGTAEIFDAYTRCACAMYKAGRSELAKEFENEFFEEVSRQRRFQKVDVLRGYAIKIPEPEYPVVAAELKKSGTVDVQVVVNEKGDVVFSCAKTKEYAFGFTNAAEKAAYGAKFLPFFVKNEPVKAVGTITYNFQY